MGTPVRKLLCKSVCSSPLNRLSLGINFLTEESYITVSSLASYHDDMLDQVQNFEHCLHHDVYYTLLGRPWLTANHVV